MEHVQVVGGCDGDDVLARVPRGVQDLFGEVEAVHVDFVLLALAVLRAHHAAVAAVAVHVLAQIADHFLRLEDLFRLGTFSRALVHLLLLAISREAFEEIVIRAAENGT